MIWFFIIIVAIVILAKVIENKLVIRFDTIFRKGFSIIKDRYGIYCFTGKMGDGKTYSIVDFISEIVKKTKKKVITNVYSYYVNNKEFAVYNDNFYDIIDKFNNGTYSKDYIIFYDELFTLLEKGKLNRSILGFISQLRKRGIYLVTSAQEWLEINVTFRRYVRYQVNCKILNLPIFGCAISINQINDGYQMHWDNLENDYVSPCIKTTIKKCSKKLADSYDTYEVIKNV